MLHRGTTENSKTIATMKNLFKKMMLVAVAAMAFVACQNEPEDINVTAKQVTVNISGDLVDTRSYFGEPDETAKTYPSKWAGGETVAFSLNEAALVEATNTLDGTRATFSNVAFADDEKTEGTIYAFSPKGVFNGSSATNNEGGFTRLNTQYQDAFVVIPEVQNPTTTSVDPSVHLLAGAYSYTDGLPTAVNMQFKHVAAYAKMTIKDFTAVIKKVEVTASEPLAGSSCWYYYAGEKVGQLINADKTTITVMNPAESNYDFWFGCAPADLTSGTLSVKVYAANGDTYTKALNIAGKNFAFNQGGVSRFTVSITAANKDEAEEEIVGDFKLVKSLSELTDGEYVIAAKSGGVYYAMSNTIEPKIDGVEVAVVNETIASADAEGYVYKIDNTGSAFTIQSVSDSKYLKYASNTDIGSQTTAYNWTIMEGTNGTFRLVSGTSGRGLIYRGSTTNRFGGYALSNATATSTEYYDIELFKKTTESGGGEEPEGPEQLAQPTNLTASNITSESFTISWSADANASSYAVSLNGADPQSVDGTSYSFTDLDAETSYTVSVVAKGDDTYYSDSEAATTTVKTLADEPIGGTVVDVLTASLFTATSTTYTDFSGVTVTSGAVYSGNSSKTSGGAIQLRSNNSNSGIVTTTSGGKVRSITVTYESGSKTMDVYGKNTAYSAASDLYSTSTRGTKIGSISGSGTITITGDYEYIGIRSKSGALYITSIEITYEN